MVEGGAQTQPAPQRRTLGATQFLGLHQRHPAHAATWNQVGQVTYQSPVREHLTATSCAGKLRSNLAAVNDVGKRSAQKRKQPKEPPGQTGSLDPVETGSVAKSYNVKLQLADASESSGPAKELDVHDVPAWRTKMCYNRISALQEEKRKLRQRERAVQEEIEFKTALRNRAAADVTWKKKEISYVGNTISDFRKELAQREKDVAEHIEEERAAILAATAEVGKEKRIAQKAREATVVATATFDIAEQAHKNMEQELTSMLTLQDIFQTIALEKQVALYP